MKTAYFLKTVCLLTLGVILCASVSAQNMAQTEPPPNPCLAAPYLDFDFWLGEWDVYGKADKSGPLLGKNSITKQQGGCLISENWLGAKGSTGTSMNFYDGTKQQWVQHWVSPGGVSISYQGGLVKGSMVLQGQIYYATESKHPVRDFKGTWTPSDNGSVRQFFEESIDGGQTWYKWFEGFYFKQQN